MRIGDRLRQSRRDRRLSLQQVAGVAGVSAATLSRIETSKQSLDVALFLKIAEILDTPPSDFLEPPAQTNGVSELRRSLLRLPPDQRTQLWSSLAVEASEGNHPDPIPERLGEMLAQIELLKAEVEAMRTQLERRG